ncbi:MAG: undecaprenyl-diphosphate phosphatase, partial [Gammaproteobacteria bacterium]|nr:undecaprenyl-diphosphate phosphatase [Gammaproteobacteria bacterium]
LVIDIAAHVGSLAAVIVYFRRDLLQMLTCWNPAPGHSSGRDRRLLLCLVLASLPIMIIGYSLYDLVSAHFRNPVIIAIATIVFALALWWADRSGKRQRTLDDVTYRDAILIGLAQAIALVPGTSRAGITMTAGLMLGMDRQAAARFSFLLAIPAIIMAGGYEGWRYFIRASDTDWMAFSIVAIVSAVSAWLTIHYFLRFLQTTGMLPYVIYRIGLGIVLLAIFT